MKSHISPDSTAISKARYINALPKMYSLAIGSAELIQRINTILPANWLNALAIFQYHFFVSSYYIHRMNIAIFYFKNAIPTITLQHFCDLISNHNEAIVSYRITPCLILLIVSRPLRLWQQKQFLIYGSQWKKKVTSSSFCWIFRNNRLGIHPNEHEMNLHDQNLGHFHFWWINHFACVKAFRLQPTATLNN